MPVSFKMKVKPAPGSIKYMDREIIRRNWSKINKNPMQRAGNLVRMIARGSIKRRSATTRSGRQKTIAERKPSPPGQPPRSWQNTGTPPMKMIFNLPNDRWGASQIVGMVGFGAGQPIPSLHEHGGMARRRVFIKQEANEGLVETGGGTRNSKGQFQKKRLRDKGGRFAKATPARTKAKNKMVRYPKRPFMQPALDKAKMGGKLPNFWRQSFGRGAKAA